MTQLEAETKTSEDEWQKAKIETQKLTAPKIPKRKFTLLNLLIISTFSSALILIFYFFYLLFYPFSPLTIKSVTITTPIVRAGGTAIYRISSCKYTQVTPMVYKRIVSSNAAEALTTSQGVVALGCSTKDVPFPILSGTPPGEYTLYTEVVYRVNAIRDIHVFWHAGPFKVQ